MIARDPRSGDESRWSVSPANRQIADALLKLRLMRRPHPLCGLSRDLLYTGRVGCIPDYPGIYRWHDVAANKKYIGMAPLSLRETCQMYEGNPGGFSAHLSALAETSGRRYFDLHFKYSVLHVISQDINPPDAFREALRIWIEEIDPRLRGALKWIGVSLSLLGNLEQAEMEHHRSKFPRGYND